MGVLSWWRSKAMSRLTVVGEASSNACNCAGVKVLAAVQQVFQAPQALGLRRAGEIGVAVEDGGEARADPQRADGVGQGQLRGIELADLQILTGTAEIAVFKQFQC